MLPLPFYPCPRCVKVRLPVEKMASSKRQSLLLTKKLEILRHLKNGRKNAELCKEYNLSRSTISTVWANKHKIYAAANQNISKLKRIKKPVRDDVDSALLKWFTVQRKSNIPVSGPLLQEKARQLGTLASTSRASAASTSNVNGNEYVCSRGWIDRFKRRYNIKSGRLHGESGSVDRSAAEDWLSMVWPNLSARYNENDIFNGDETGLFFKATPDKTLKFKGEKCHGGKQAKDRLTVLVCANMSGTEKRQLLVVGKSVAPRCFKNCSVLPVKYTANKRAWMTSEIFEKELRDWDRELARKQRRILLLVDNCPAHPHVENLQFMELVFLPPNVTAILQPMDQGVIRCLKAHYRKMLLTRLIQCAENKEQFSISVLDALVMIKTAWNRVSQETLRNCFRHAGFFRTSHFEPEDDLPLIEWISLPSREINGEDDLPLLEWARKNNVTEFSEVDLNDYMSIDDGLITYSMPTDEELVTSVINDNVLEVSDTEQPADSSEGQTSEQVVPTLAEAVQALKTVSHYVQFSECDNALLETCDLLQAKLEKHYLAKRSRQMKITDYVYSS